MLVKLAHETDYRVTPVGHQKFLCLGGHLVSLRAVTEDIHDRRQQEVVLLTNYRGIAAHMFVVVGTIDLREFQTVHAFRAYNHFLAVTRVPTPGFDSRWNSSIIR